MHNFNFDYQDIIIKLRFVFLTSHMKTSLSLNTPRVYKCVCVDLDYLLIR